MPIRSRDVLPFLVILASCKDRERLHSDSSASRTPTVVAHGVAPRITAPVTEHGIGPLRVGMTVKEARAALGMFEVSAPAQQSACDYATTVGLPPGVSVMVESGTVGRIDVDSNSVGTAEGARIGDSEESVRRLYGERVSVSTHEYTDGHYLTVKSSSSGRYTASDHFRDEQRNSHELPSGSTSASCVRRGMFLNRRRANEELKPTAAPSSLVESFTASAAAELRRVSQTDLSLNKDADARQ